MIADPWSEAGGQGRVRRVTTGLGLGGLLRAILRVASGLPVPQPPHLPALPPCVGRYGNGVIATPNGPSPTDTVATTVLLAVAITDTSLSKLFGT